MTNSFQPIPAALPHMDDSGEALRDRRGVSALVVTGAIVGILLLIGQAGCSQVDSANFTTYQDADTATTDVSIQANVADNPETVVSAPGDPVIAEITPRIDPDTEARDAVQTTPEDGSPEPNLDTAAMDAVIAGVAVNPAADSTTLDGSNDDRPVTTSESKPDESVTAVLAARRIELLIPENSFRVEGPEDARRVSYDDIDLLKILNMEPVPVDAESHFPDWLRELDGRRIVIRGFMYPTFVESGITSFVLARDNDICCFGRNPKLYDVFAVVLRDGQTTDYIEGHPFDVAGVFHIDPIPDGDELYQLYRIDDAVVIDR